MPEISVIVPTYNQLWYLPKTLHSLSVQNFRDMEVVIVDDGSTDGTAMFLRSCTGPGSGMKTIHHDENRGWPEAVNTGVREARGNWIAVLNSDNHAEQTWLEDLHDAVDDETGAVHSWFCKYKWVGGREPPIPIVTRKPKWEAGRLISGDTFYIGPSWIMHADVWRETGGYRGAFASDYDHWLRMEEVCRARGLRIKTVPEVHIHYMIHDDMLSKKGNPPAEAREWREQARKRRGL